MDESTLENSPKNSLLEVSHFSVAARSLLLRAFPMSTLFDSFNTCGRFPGTHGGVLNAHTEAF